MPGCRGAAEEKIKAQEEEGEMEREREKKKRKGGGGRRGRRGSSLPSPVGSARLGVRALAARLGLD